MKKAPVTFHRAGAGEQLSFLPPPTFCPVWPTRGTLPYRALLMMMDGTSIDHPQFELRTGSWRLAAAIFTLIALGWPVVTIEVLSPTHSCPWRVIARYKLDTPRMATAGTMAEEA